MKRRILDVLFSAGGIVLAGLLLVLGLVMTSNANFADNYVHDQLSQQNIAFPPAAALSDEEAKSACLVEFAGQDLTTGKQAECYANDFIGFHLSNIAGGQTFADLGEPESALRAQVAAAETAGDPELDSLTTQLAEVSSQRDTLFKGETLRGLLLTSFGFSEFGVKGGQVATVAYLVAALLALLSVAGFLHAFRTPREETVAALDHAPSGIATPAVAGT